jgi:hypothetical protein
LQPLNINADLNGAYVTIALLYGKGEFERTMDIAMRSGQDSDSNPATAAGIMGTVIGYRAIPKKWRSAVDRIADQKFTYVDVSLNAMVASTIERAKKVTRLEGGMVTEDFLAVPYQIFDALPLEAFDPGSAVERISSDDPRWTFTPGDSATVIFSGTGVILAGKLSPAGGSFEIYLDGARVATGDAYDESEREHEGFWGRFDLAPGNHVLRVAAGTLPDIEDLIVFRK